MDPNSHLVGGGCRRKRSTADWKFTNLLEKIFAKLVSNLPELAATAAKSRLSGHRWCSCHMARAGWKPRVTEPFRRRSRALLVATRTAKQGCHLDTGTEAEKGRGLLPAPLPAAPYARTWEGRAPPAAPETRRELPVTTPNRHLPPASQTLPISLRRREASHLASLGPSASMTCTELHPPTSLSFQPPTHSSGGTARLLGCSPKALIHVFIP